MFNHKGAIQTAITVEAPGYVPTNRNARTAFQTSTNFPMWRTEYKLVSG